MTDESDIKRAMVKRIKEEGGYGRRLEDKWAVGLPDLILIPKHGFVFLAEVKTIRGGAKFGCTPRQLEELNRITKVEGYAVPVLVGYEQSIHRRLFACRPAIGIHASDAITSELQPWNISELLNRYAETMNYQQYLNSEGQFTASLPKMPE